MPPKKKTRGPSRVASSPADQAIEDARITRETDTETPDKPQTIQDDNWTDDQEAVLFKGIIRWKPENAFSRASSPDTEESEMPSHQFALPQDDFGKMIFDRRLAPEGSSSPPASTRPPSAGSTSLAVTRRASTIEDTEDLRSSPASARGAKATGSARQTRSTRRSHLHEVSSLPERRKGTGSKISPNEDSIETLDVEQAETHEEDGEEENLQDVADQHGEAYFSYGPLEDIETIEFSSASSASSDQEDHGDTGNLLEDLWSDKEILKPIAGHIQLTSWERRYNNPSKGPCWEYTNKVAPRIRSVASGHAENSDLPVLVSESDAILSSLVHVAFGRESTIYRYDEKRKGFRPVDDGAQICGYTPRIFHDLTVDLVEYGSQMRQAKEFSEKIRQTKAATNSLVALASGVDITIRALEAQMSASLSCIKTVLQLQTLLDPLRRVLETISSIISIVDQADEMEDDNILLSKLFEIVQDPEHSTPGLRLVMSELLAHVSRPWLESVEVSSGLKEEHTLGGIPSMKTRFHQPNEDCPNIAVDDIEVGENSPGKMPVFISTELTETFLEVVDSLQLLRAYGPQHPLARPRELSIQEPPTLQWQFSWQDIEGVKAKAQTYESNVLQACKAFHSSGSTVHQAFAEQSEGLVQDTEIKEVFDFLWDIDAPLSSPMAGSPSRLATTVIQTLSRTHPFSPGPTTPPMSHIPSLSFGPTLMTQSRLLSHSTLHMLFHSHALRSHLRLLRSYLLFANGPFLVHLSHTLFDRSLPAAEYPTGHLQFEAGTKELESKMREVWPPMSSELRIALMGLLIESYYSSPESKLTGGPPKVRTDKAELPGGLSFAVRNDMSDEELQKCSNVDGLESLDFLKIQYRPPKPLDVVITDSVLEKYDRVSRLLLRGARVGWVVKEMIKQPRGMGWSGLRSRLGQKFKIEVHHFVTMVFGHFGDSIEELWVAFETKLDDIEASIEYYEAGQKIEGIHRLRTLHEEVLDRILASCLLRKRQELVMNLLEEILGLVLQFASFMKHRKWDEERKSKDIYETWRTKVRVFITVCKGLQDQESVAGKKDVFDGGKFGGEKGNGIGRLVLRLEMNGWYMR
ncbi:MAG: hypothetical protein Q9226_004778 [Calogaya cf. arnoldii]